jgi:nitroreductase
LANPVYDAASTVLAVREFQEKAVPDESLRRILEAGHLTASAGNGQPWHFLVVRDRDRIRKLGSLIRTAPYVANAPAAIVVAYEKGTGPVGISDAARAVQSMLLTAWGEGIGSNWSGFSNLDGVRAEFGFPDTFEAIAVLPLGYPRHKVIGKKKRKPFDDVVSAERFGRHLE